MQTFLKLATGELDISRTKILMSIRRLIDKEKLNKVRSNRDEKNFLYMDENNMSEFDALFEDVEKFLSC